MVIQLVKARSAESRRIGGTQAEVARGIHQRGLGREVPVEGFVIGQAKSHGGSESVKEQHFVLCKSGCRVGILVDVARGGSQVVLAPVSTEDGG